MFKKITWTLLPLCFCIFALAHIFSKSLETFSLNMTSNQPVHLIIAIDQNPAMRAYSEQGSPFIQAKALAKELIVLFKDSHVGLLEFNYNVNPISILTTDTQYLLRKLDALSEKPPQNSIATSHLTHVYDYANMAFNYPLKSKRWVIVLSNGNISYSVLTKEKKQLYQLKPIFVDFESEKTNNMHIFGAKESPQLEAQTLMQKHSQFKELARSNQALLISHKTIEKSAQTVYKHIIQSQKPIVIKNTTNFLLPILGILLCYILWLFFCRIPKRAISIIGVIVVLSIALTPNPLQGFTRQLHQGISPDELQLVFSLELQDNNPLFSFESSYIPDSFQVKSTEHFIKVTQSNNVLKATQIALVTIYKPLNDIIYLPELKVNLNSDLASTPAKTVSISKLPASLYSPETLKTNISEDPTAFIFQSESDADTLFPQQDFVNNYHILTRNLYFKEAFIQLQDWPMSKSKQMWFCPEKKVFERFGLRYYKSRILCKKSSNLSRTPETTAFLKSLNNTLFISKTISKDLFKKALPTPIPDSFKNAYNIDTISLLNQPKIANQFDRFLVQINVEGKSFSNLNALDITYSKAFEVYLVDYSEKLFSKQFIYLVKALEVGNYPFPEFSSTYFDTQKNLFVTKTSNSSTLSIQATKQAQASPRTTKDVFFHSPKSWAYHYVFLIGMLLSLVFIFIPKNILKRIKKRSWFILIFLFLMAFFPTNTLATPCPKSVPSTLFMSSEKVFNIAKACYHSRDLVKAKGFLFKAYQKKPLDSKIKQSYLRISSAQIDTPSDIFSLSVKNILSLHYLSLTDITCLYLGLILIGLVLLRKKNTTSGFSLFIISISTLIFGYKFIHVIYDPYAIVKSNKAQIFLEDNTTLSPIGWVHQGLLLELGKTKNDYRQIKHQGLKLWIKETDTWKIP